MRPEIVMDCICACTLNFFFKNRVVTHSGDVEHTCHAFPKCVIVPLSKINMKDLHVKHVYLKKNIYASPTRVLGGYLGSYFQKNVFWSIFNHKTIFWIIALYIMIYLNFLESTYNTLFECVNQPNHQLNSYLLIII